MPRRMPCRILLAGSSAAVLGGLVILALGVFAGFAAWHWLSPALLVTGFIGLALWNFVCGRGLKRISRIT